MPWAENVLVTVSGLSREERNAVKLTLEGAGGRYTPSLSRRCTHLVVSHDADAASSRKLALALHNIPKWRTHIVTPAWITACSEGGVRLPEQDFAAPVLQEHVPAPVLSEQQRNSNHASETHNSAVQQSTLPSCASPIAAIPGPAAAQVPVGSPPVAKPRRRRQHSRRLSRFAPGLGTAAQESEAILPRQVQQPSGFHTLGTCESAASKRCGEKPAAAEESPKVEASGPVYGRRHGRAARITHPAQQPLQQLPGGNALHQHLDSIPCQSHMHAPPPPVMSAPSGASLGQPQQIQPQCTTVQWLRNHGQQPISSHHEPTLTAVSIRAADGSSKSGCGGDVTGTQLAHAVDMPVRSMAQSARGVLGSPPRVKAEGVSTGPCGASARTGSGGGSLGGSMGWATGACTDGRAAKLAALCQSRNSSCGGDLTGTQLAQAVEMPARSMARSARGVLGSPPRLSAEGVSTGACGATAKTGSGGVPMGRSVGWATGACTDGLAAKLAALCHSRNSLTSSTTLNSNPSRRHSMAAADTKPLPAQSSTSGFNEAVKARPSTMELRQSVANHDCVAINGHPAGDGRSGAEESANKTVSGQGSRNAVGLARCDAHDQPAMVSSSGRPAAKSGTEEGASSCVRGSSIAHPDPKSGPGPHARSGPGPDARSGRGPQPCAVNPEIAEHKEALVPGQQNDSQRDNAAEQSPGADTALAEREACEEHEQEGKVSRGVFHGMRAVLDSSLDPSEASRVREAIVSGGGECATGGFLGGLASHVICSPTAASKWLAMGVHVVSAAWVLQSAKSGRQERCLLLSADALRGLPLAFPSMQERQHPSDVSPDAAARSAGTCATGAHVWQALLDQADQRASAMSHHHQTPATLLEDVVWAVTDPPEKARLDNTCASFAEVPEAEQAEVVPDSEDEQDSMCAGDWDHAFFSAPAITVLFPADVAGVLCHVSRTLRCDAPGPSRRHLLAFVHAFYQEKLTAAEISEALQGGLRCSSEVRGALLAGRGIRRGDLLGSRRNFEGLSRVSRCRNATVYELNLGC